MIKDNTIALYMLHVHLEAYDPYNDELTQLDDIDHSIPFISESGGLVMTILNRVDNDVKNAKMKIPSYWELTARYTIEIIKSKKGGEIEWKRRNG